MAPHQPAGQAELEANARHSSATALEDVPPAAARARPTDFARIVAAWNDHRGALPEVRDVTEGRKKAVRRLLADCGGEVDRAVQVLTEATREAAQDGFWQERRYGFDNLVPGKVTQKAEAWRTRQGQVSTAPTPTTAPTLSTRIFQVGQRVSYKRDHYAVETVTDTYIDLYDDLNGSARVLLSSSDWNAVRPVNP